MGVAWIDAGMLKKNEMPLSISKHIETVGRRKHNLYL